MTADVTGRVIINVVPLLTVRHCSSEQAIGTDPAGNEVLKQKASA